MTAPDPVAYFEGWRFTTNFSKFECPSMASAQCKPPGNACARDPNTGQQYCCDGPPQKGRVCWGFESSCKNDGSTIGCTDGKRTFCCRAGFEKCSETPGQAAGICWSTRYDPLNNITFDDLSKVHSSLNSSRPSATLLNFDIFPIISATATAPFATASGPATSGSPTPTSAPSGSSTPAPAPPAGSGQPAQPAPESSSSLSGGAIGGIVVGTIAGVALIGLAIFFLLKRRRKTDQAYQPYAGGAPAGASEKDGATRLAEAPGTTPYSATTAGGHGGSFYSKPGGAPSYYHQQQPQELGAHGSGYPPSELPASMPHELPTSSVPTSGFSATGTPAFYHPSPFTETRSPAS